MVQGKSEVDQGSEVKVLELDSERTGRGSDEKGCKGRYGGMETQGLLKEGGGSGRTGLEGWRTQYRSLGWLATQFEG